MTKAWAPSRGGFLAQVAVKLSAMKPGEVLYWSDIAFMSNGISINYLKALIDNGWAVLHAAPQTRKEKVNANPSWVRGPNIPDNFTCVPMPHIADKIKAMNEKVANKEYIAQPRGHISTELYTPTAWASVRPGADNYKNHRSLGFNAHDDAVPYGPGMSSV
jgi:hypothetical protein